MRTPLWLSALKRSFGGRKCAPIRTRAADHRLRCEPLEDRTAPAVLSTFLTTEHVDLNVGYAGGTWSLQPRDDDNGGASYAPDVALLYVGDNGQSRVARPADPAFAFTGVGAGQQFYRLPQSQNPELLYLGFAGYGANTNDFDRYNPSAESKGRVSGLGRWLKVSLVGVEHTTPDGQAGDGQFSVWQSGDSGPNVFLSTHDDGVANPNGSGLDATDGVGADDALWIVAGGHIHYNWGFTEAGRYEVTVRLSGYLNDGNTTSLGQYVESEPITLYFSVGSVGELAFDAPSYTVNESAGTASVTVRRTGGSDGRITVNYATSNGTATAGADYTAASGTLTFNDGETAKTITVPITDDGAVEGDETVNLTLSAPGPSGIQNYLIDYEGDPNGLLGATSAATLTILDNDSPTNSPPTVTNVPDQTTDEDTPKQAVGFTVGDAETPAGDLVVTVASSNTTLVPSANLAAGGSGADRALTITPAADQFGTTTITITVTDAGGLTATDTFVLTVNPVNDAPVADPQNASTDEDTPKPITLTGSDVEGGELTYVVVSGPSHGSLSGSGANRTYTPDPNFFGTDSFTFRANDGAADSAVATVTITVNPVNDAPAANAQNVSTDEDTPKSITLTGSDAEGDTLTFTIVSGPSHGSLSGTGPNLTYTPDADFTGTDSFTFKVDDGSLDSAVATVTIAVGGVNDPPTISGVADQTVDEDTPTAALSFTVGDAETPAASLVVTASSSNTSLVPVANVTLGGSGASRTVVVTPAANQFGTADVTLTVTDAGGATATTTFRVTVNSANDLPTISPITDVVMNEDGDVTINFTVGDVETAAGSLTVTGTRTNTTLFPSIGTSAASRLRLGGTGTNRTLRIRPAGQLSGESDVTLTVTDANGGTAQVTFKITVDPVNDPPFPQEDSVFAHVGTATPISVLSNDVDIDSTSISLVSFTQPSSGTVTEGAGGVLTYTPQAGFRGFDSFTYTIQDSEGATATTTVELSVGVIDIVHTDLDVNYLGGEWYSSIHADYTPDAHVDSDEAVLFANPSSKITLPALPPSYSFIGAGEGDEIWLLPQVQESDKLWLGFSNEGTNPAFLASHIRLDLISFSGPGHFSLFQEGSFGEPLAWIDTADGVNSADDADVGGNAADFYTLFVRGHSHLNWTFTQPGRYTITLQPTALVNTTDAQGNPIQVSSTGPAATFYIDVDALTGIPLGENPPLARNDAASAVEDGGPVAINVLANDSSSPDPDEALTVTAVSHGAHGSVAIAPDGKSVRYTPAADFSGTDSFTYTVTDEHGGAATATVTVTVAPAHDSPQTSDDAYALSEGNVVRGNVLFNDTDADGDPLTASLLDGPSHGAVALAADGSFTYAAGSSFAGSDSFTYAVTDPTGASATATVTVAGAGFQDFEAILTEGHADVGIAYEDGEWDLHAHDEEHDAEYEPAEALLYVGPQAERTRPAGAQFDFIGVAGGEAFWELPHSPPNPELLLLGFGTEEIEDGTFTDGLVRLQLKAVNGPGHFSVWRSTDAGPEVFMSTADGITAADLFTGLTGGHEDMNWGFTARGRYEVTFQAWGYPDDGDDVPDFSDDVTYYFSVDNLGRLQLDAPTYTAGEGGTATVTVRRVDGSDGPLTADYASTGGTATAGVDYVPFGGSLTFADGETEKTFAIPALADDAVEGDETVLLALSAPPEGPTRVGTPGAATLTIADDDPPLTVRHVAVNGGVAQRSNVESITVRFSRETNVQSLIDGGAIVSAVRVFSGGSPLSLSAADYRYDAATNSLTVDLTTDGFGGSRLTRLADGDYELRLDASLISTTGRSPANLLRDTDGTDDGVYRHAFHRLLGDFDGDRVVGTADLALFLAHYGAVSGRPTYDFAFDLTGPGETPDGVISMADYVLMRRLLGRRL